MGDRLSDADIESLISGSTEVDPSLGELIAEMREYADWKPDPSQQANHIVGAMAAVRATAEGAAGVVNDLSSPGMTRRREMIGRIMATRTARVLAAALATLLATSGIAWAATGSNPVSQVSSVVEQVGQVFNNDVDDDQVADENIDINDIDDNQVDETDVNDTDDDHAAVVDDSKDDEVEDTEVDDIDDDHAAVTDDTSDDDHVKESDHEEDDHAADHESDSESESDD